MQIKRRFARWKIDTQAKLKVSDNDTLNTCSISNISLKGVTLSLNERLEKDVLLSLTIVFSDDCAVHTQAWVVWHKCIQGRNHYGLYFKQINDHSKDEIYRFMQTTHPQSIIRQWNDTGEKGDLSMEDRRIFERFATRLPLRFLNINNGKEGAAETRDISVKGVGMVSAEEFSLRAPMELWVDVPNGGGGPLYSRGYVAWSKPAPNGQYWSGINLDHADLMGVARVLRAAKK